MDPDVYEALERLLSVFAKYPCSDGHIEHMFISTFHGWTRKQLGYFKPDWKEYMPNISKDKALKIAVAQWLNILGADPEALLQAGHPWPPLQDAIDVGDGWEIELFWRGKIYCFTVSEDESCYFHGHSWDSQTGDPSVVSPKRSPIATVRSQ